MLEVSTPILVGLASGSVLFIYFVSFDRPGVLAVAAVIGYWVLFACTYLILGRPGRDWWLPVDVRAFAATFEGVFRAAFGYARSGLAALVAGARTAAREARLPVDVRAFAATFEGVFRAAFEYARSGLAALVAGARTAARKAAPALSALAALAAARPPPGSPAVARSGDRHEADAGAGAAWSSDNPR